MNSVIFKNKGLIDIKAITTFGISSKEGDNPIGFFGTGLKYAIAVLLREGCNITIFSGTERYDFTTEMKTVRINDFNFIQMNGVELAFTTDLGKTWELWQAYRELYCNCMDEKGEVYLNEADTALDRTANETTIVINGSKFETIHETKSDFILESNPIFTTKGLEIHFGESQFLFYKGIRIYKLNNPSLYTYNLTDKVDLTEDRTLKYYWTELTNIAKALVKVDLIHLLDKILFSKDKFEDDLDFYRRDLEPCKEFIDYATTHVKKRSQGINPTLRKYVLVNLNLDELLYEELKLNEIQKLTLTKSVNFCKLMGFEIDKYPIKVVKTLGNNVLGQARKETIYLSERTFMMGTKMVTGTIMEEFLHLDRGLFDETRDMQNYLIDMIISFAEQLHNQSL
jgi:hypothetical protein